MPQATGTVGVDKWHRIHLLSEVDGLSPVEGVARADVTVEYASADDTSWSTAVMADTDWKEVGDGEYGAQVGEDEWVGAAEYVLRITTAGARPFTFPVMVSNAVLNLTPDAINVAVAAASAGLTASLPPAAVNIAVTPQRSEFNGTAQYINTDYEPVWTQADSFTWGMWFKTTTTTASRRFLGAHNNLGAGNGAIYVATAYTMPDTFVSLYLRDDGGDGPAVAGTIPVNDGEWHHFAAVRNRATDLVKTYIDGVEDISTADTTTGDVTLTGYPLYIGAYNDNGTPTTWVAANIYEVCSWDVALTEVQVQGLAADRRIAANSLLPGNVVYYLPIGRTQLELDYPASPVNVLAQVQSATPTYELQLAAPVNVATAVLQAGLGVGLAPLQVDVLVATQTPGLGMTLSANPLDVAAAVEAAAPTIILAANVQDVQALAQAITKTIGIPAGVVNVSAAAPHPTLGVAATRTIIITLRGARTH